MNDTIHLGTIEAVPRCGKCGSDDLRMPEGVTSQDDLIDDSVVTCADCGTVTTYAALVASCEADVAKNVINDLGSAGDDPLG
jgi:uncharacterized Zn finger protein